VSNSTFKKLLENGDIHKIGLHPERWAVYLNWVHGYKTAAFYDFRNNKPIWMLFSEDNGLNKPKFEGFTPLREHDWVGVKEASDITKSHMIEANVVSAMALYLGENVVQDSQHRMDWTALEENFGEFVPLWHLMVRDANATERIVPSGIELDCGNMQLDVCVVIFVTDKLRKPKSRRMESGFRRHRWWWNKIPPVPLSESHAGQGM
jgi:hypothetical protein